jgi:hypothetical protein
LADEFQTLPLTLLSSAPRCVSRENKGIEAAKSDWIFLCDDDIELPRDHFQHLADHVAKHPGCGAVAGKLRQLESGVWVDQYPPRRFFTAALSVRFPALGLGTFRWRENESILRDLVLARSIGGVAAAGQQGKPSRDGLSLHSGNDPASPPGSIRWAQTSCEESCSCRRALRPGCSTRAASRQLRLALGCPTASTCIDSTFALHHREAGKQVNRKTPTIAASWRCITLSRARFTNATITTFWLCWSIVGLSLHQICRLDLPMLKLSAKAFFRIVAGRNPYVIAKDEGRVVVSPD